MKLRKIVLVCLMMLGMSAAWAGKPILNLVDETVPGRFDGGARTLDEVQEAIVKGCQRKGWRPFDDGENKIKCTILVRGRHYAEVSIPYSESKYSILYVASRELDYNEKKQKIHKNYNRWVVNLSAAIQQEFELM